MKFISAILLLLLVFCQEGRAEEGSTIFHEYSQPLVPPQFLILGEDHQKHLLNEYKEHVIILNLWATWCAPCMKEMPSLDRLAGALDPKTYHVIALNENYDGQIVASAYYLQHHLTHLHIDIDPTLSVPNLFRFQGLPVSLIIDKSGKVRGYYEGDVDWTSSEVRALLARYAFEPKSG